MLGGGGDEDLRPRVERILSIAIDPVGISRSVCRHYGVEESVVKW